MKKKTAKLILTNKGEVNKSILNAIEHCRFDSSSRKIYVGYYTGTGRYTSSYSAKPVIVNILNAQGYKYKIGNDAPRGGISGDYIKVSRTAFNFIYNIKK